MHASVYATVCVYICALVTCGCVSFGCMLVCAGVFLSVCLCVCIYARPGHTWVCVFWLPVDPCVGG